MSDAREVIGRFMQFVDDGESLAWEDMREWDRDGYLVFADDVLRELTAAGIGLYDLATEVKVDRARFERLQDAASELADMAAAGRLAGLSSEDVAESLQSGDLDPLPEVK